MVIAAAYVVLFVLALHSTAATGICKPVEIKVCLRDLSQACFCKRCITCPPGYGLNHQCGGQVWNDTVIKCVPCKKGVSYSEDSSISACEPCPQCDGKKTLQECTSTNKTVCSEDECEEGYVRNSAVNDCIKVRTIIKSTKEFSTTSSPPSIRTLEPKTTIYSAITTPTSFKITKQNRFGTTNTKSFKDGIVTKKYQKDHSKDNKTLLFIILIFMIVVAVVVVIVVVACVVHFLKTRQVACFHSTKDAAGQQEETIALNPFSSTSTRSSQESVEDLWPVNLCLKDIPPELSWEICIKISLPSTVNKGWREIGQKKGLSEIDLDAIDGALEPGINKGKQLFKKFETSDPKFTLNEFVLILQNLEREDVLKIIRTFYRSHNNANQTYDAV